MGAQRKETALLVWRVKANSRYTISSESLERWVDFLFLIRDDGVGEWEDGKGEYWRSGQKHMQHR